VIDFLLILGTDMILAQNLNLMAEIFLLMYVMLAQRILFINKIIKFRAKLYKAKNSLIIYIRTEKIGLRVYLYSRKIWGINLFNYDCG